MQEKTLATRLDDIRKDAIAEIKAAMAASSYRELDLCDLGAFSFLDMDAEDCPEREIQIVSLRSHSLTFFVIENEDDVETQAWDESDLLKSIGTEDLMLLHNTIADTIADALA